MDSSTTASFSRRSTSDNNYQNDNLTEISHSLFFSPLLLNNNNNNNNSVLGGQFLPNSTNTTTNRGHSPNEERIISVDEGWMINEDDEIPPKSYDIPNKLISDYIKIGTLAVFLLVSLPVNLIAFYQLNLAPSSTMGRRSRRKRSSQLTIQVAPDIVDIRRLKINLNIANLLVTLFYGALEVTWTATYRWVFGGRPVYCQLLMFMRVFGFQLTSNVTAAIAVNGILMLYPPHTAAPVTASSMSSINKKSIRRRLFGRFGFGFGPQFRFRLVLLIGTIWLSAAVCALPQIFVWTTFDVSSNRSWIQCMTVWEIRRLTTAPSHGASSSIKSTFPSTPTIEVATNTSPSTIPDYISDRLYNVIHLISVFWIPLTITTLCHIYSYIRILKSSINYRNNQGRRYGSGSGGYGEAAPPGGSPTDFLMATRNNNNNNNNNNGQQLPLPGGGYPYYHRRYYNYQRAGGLELGEMDGAADLFEGSLSSRQGGHHLRGGGGGTNNDNDIVTTAQFSTSIAGACSGGVGVGNAGGGTSTSLWNDGGQTMVELRLLSAAPTTLMTPNRTTTSGGSTTTKTNNNNSSSCKGVIVTPDRSYYFGGGTNNITTGDSINEQQTSGAAAAAAAASEQQLRKVSTRSTTKKTSQATTISSSRQTTTEQLMKQAHSIALFSIFKVTVVYVLCWLPYNLVQSIKVMNRRMYEERADPKFEFLNVLIAFYCVFNPFLYNLIQLRSRRSRSRSRGGQKQSTKRQRHSSPANDGSRTNWCCSAR